MTKRSLSTRARPAIEPAPGGPAPVPIPLAVRAGTLAAITIPALGLAAAPFLAWGWGFRWADLGLLLGMTALTGLGITVGFHRLFTHRSFETVRPVQFALGVLGSMAVQGPLWKWVATHRRHHRHSDREGDPHSPHPHAAGLAGVLHGFWHAHVGLVGALIGGFLFGHFVTGTYAFVGSVVVAFLGACLLIWVARQITPGRSYA